MSADQPGWVLCDRCGRVLNPDDGPTCPECRAEERREAREKAKRDEARDAKDTTKEAT
jgi:RNA polymerase subunit RPABC4/transcription elongation factor Spt4